MWKKLLILSLFISVLLAFSAHFSPVNAEDGKKGIAINWQIAGTIVQQIDARPIGTTSFDPHFLINLAAQGSPGPAKITLLSKSKDYEGSNLPCENDFYPIANFEVNDFIALFPDQSLLFASIGEGDSILCVDSYEAPTKTYFAVNMEITGGKGRFEGAGGYFTAEGYGFLGFSTEGTLVGENGTITGTIEFPD